LDGTGDGVWFVDLAPITNAALVGTTTAAALHVSERAEEPVSESLVRELTGQERLLVPDNCEHLIARSSAVSALGGLLAAVVRLVRACLSVFATHRKYGMPAYAKHGKVVCFFQSATKFKARYATVGFSDDANLDDGNMWPTSFALKALTSAEKKKIAALVKKAPAEFSLRPRHLWPTRDG
jgi:hypothetical protein